MPLYHKLKDIEIRLAGKLRFTDDPADVDLMPISLVRSLMNEAEGQVEMALSPRFMAPFQTDAGLAFQSLPERPTRLYIRTLCEIQSVLRILETDFGRGTAIGGDGYTKNMSDRYTEMVDRLMKKKDDTTQAWVFPPLDGLRLALFNEKADDGFQGMPLNSSDDSDNSDSFPQKRINSPGETFWTPSRAECDDL